MKSKQSNICFYCKKACGDCSWSAYDPKEQKLLFEPIPGWTAEPATQYTGDKAVPTYRITACPEFTPDKDFVFKCKCCGAQMTINTRKVSYCKKCAPDGKKRNAKAKWGANRDTD